MPEPRPRTAAGEQEHGPPAAEQNTTILAVDTRPLVRGGLTRSARAAAVGQVLALADLAQAAAAIRRADIQPRALLIGLRAGDDPAALLAAARRLAPIVVFIIDTSDAQLLAAAEKTQPDGLLSLAATTPDTLANALDAAETGAPIILSTFNEAGQSLTARHHEILTALCHGLQDDEIAAQLGITTSSVRKHVASAQQRLDARTRTQAVAIAVRKGWLRTLPDEANDTVVRLMHAHEAANPRLTATRRSRVKAPV